MPKLLATAVMVLLGASPNTARGGTGDPLMNAQLARYPAIGASCPQKRQLPGGVELLCDAKDRVAGLYLPADYLLGEPPTGATVLRRTRQPHDLARRGARTLVAIEGQRLWIRVVTCGICRRIMGWAFAGELNRMRPQQVQALQEKLGLAKKPLLTTPNAWVRAFEPPKAAAPKRRRPAASPGAQAAESPPKGAH